MIWHIYFIISSYMLNKKVFLKALLGENLKNLVLTDNNFRDLDLLNHERRKVFRDID